MYTWAKTTAAAGTTTNRSAGVISLAALSEEGAARFGAFLGRDCFGGCFCAVWTAHGEDWVKRCEDPDRPNLNETLRRLRAGEHVGYFASEGGEVVAWTGSGPKTSFPLLATKLGSRLSPMTSSVWSVGCIAIAAEHRGRGLSARVAQAVVDEARARGAKAIEAYPTRPWDEGRSYRGAQSTYEKLGLQVVEADPDGDSEILLMRLDL